MPESDPENEFHISVVRAGDELNPTTGAYGTITNDGQYVTVHLYYEYPSTPSLIRHNVDENGRVNLAEGEAVKQSDLTRVLHTSTLMTPRTAFIVGQWLIEKSREAAARLEEMREIAESSAKETEGAAAAATDAANPDA